MTKKNVGSATVTKLNALGLELVDAKARKKTAETDITRITGEMEQLAAKYTLPIQDGKSEYLNLSGGGAVRVTRPSAPVRKIITLRLLEQIRARPGLTVSEANQVFLDVAVLAQYCDIDVTRWNGYVEDETLVNSILRDALEDARPAPKPNVQLTSTKRLE